MRPFSPRGREPGREGGMRLVGAANTSTQNFSNDYSILEPTIRMADHDG
jgi:hypothetical protein